MLDSSKGLFCNSLSALPEDSQIWDVEDLIHEFHNKGKHCITFIGFGELGYNDSEVFYQVVECELSTYDPQRHIINTATLITAGFENGITDVYQIAKSMGFETTGIHPSIALTSKSEYFLSAFVDEPYFVNDDTWGGLIQATAQPSATLKTLLSISKDVIAIGGGKYTAQEISAFEACGKPVTYYVAEMNHHVSSRWARERGESICDFRGEAFLLLNQ